MSSSIRQFLIGSRAVIIYELEDRQIDIQALRADTNVRKCRLKKIFSGG
ncbi:hypothetical protein CHCC20335_2537 [Bacillus paralicheniformis]|nr:hypothetical protein CHCC20335_2537 [Bacillus paralicheniformis]